MRVTANSDDDVLDEARRMAAEKGRTLSAVVTDMLREGLIRSGYIDREPCDPPDTLE